MPKTLFITRGEYAGRYMTLDDDIASSAESDGWGRQSDSQTPEELKQEEERRASGEIDEDPDSLTEWEDSLNVDPTAETDDTTAPSKPRRRKTTGS